MSYLCILNTKHGVGMGSKISSANVQKSTADPLQNIQGVQVFLFSAQG